MSSACLLHLLSSLTILNSSERRSTIQYKLYHPNFRRKLRLQCLANAGYQCERCGIKHRSFALNSLGEIYIVYLQVAHVFADDKTNPNAPLLCLCARCHRFYDHPRKSGAEAVADWQFIGTVMRRFIEQDISSTGGQDDHLGKTIPHRLD